MSNTALVNRAEKFGGQYVTVRSFASKTVITHGKKPLDVLNRARKKGIEDPVLYFIPKKGMVHLY